ncbi:MAG TPA: DUF2284 domain-containing protein [Candidatus Wallbacteria bacterium]|nr:DUF2284 domain-containing protein [Candidatus Wallbacteria bacterium]
MNKYANIEEIFKKFECPDYKFIRSSDIVVSQWVRMKCMFGCSGFGKSLSCPPNVPSIAECREFFKEFEEAVLFHFTMKVIKPEDRKLLSDKINGDLLNVEREVFLSGLYRAFMLPVNECHRCVKCCGKKESCPHSEKVRPMPEAMGVDLFATANRAGYPVKVLKNYDETMNRYAILMLE